MSDRAKGPSGDLSGTALYTAGAWQWCGFPEADLLAAEDARAVFRGVNLVLGLARILRPGGPSLRHSLAQRHAIIDRLVAESGAVQVLELAAGLSPRGLALTVDPDIRCVEVDLPPMIERKRQLLQRTSGGRVAARRPNLRLVAGDVLTVDFRELVDGADPAMVVAEGLVMYLDAEQQRALWRRVASLGNAQLVFDHVPWVEQRPPGRIGRLLDEWFRDATGGHGFVRDGRTRADIAGDLYECGFTAVRTYEPSTVARSWSLPFSRKRTQTLVFHCA